MHTALVRGGMCALPRRGHAQPVGTENAGPADHRVPRTCMARLWVHENPGGGPTLDGVLVLVVYRQMRVVEEPVPERVPR